jgi:DNA-binding MarR family transcriptional regulator
MTQPTNQWVLAPRVDPHQRSEGDLDQMTDAFLTASRALVGVAVRSIQDAPLEITVVQHRVLVLLEEEGDVSVGALAEQLNVNPSNATRVCDRLERLELVHRVPSEEDGRAVCVRITDKGRQVVREVTELRQAELLRILQRMPTAVARRAADAVEAFAAAAGRRSSDQSGPIGD